MKANSEHPLFAEERREQILRLLHENMKIMVPELCELFGVSPATIRGDLRDLEAEGKLRRTHGGAIPVSKIGFEPDSNMKEIEHIEEKQRIAACACSMIEDGDTIALDTGTTTMELAKLLPEKKNLTIVTNDIQIAAFLETNAASHVILIGGVLRRGFPCTTGSMAVKELSALNVDKAFLASNAFTVKNGFTTPTFEQAEVKRVMLSISSLNIVLLDSSKLGRITFLKFADVSDVDRIVTDNGVSRKMLAAIREANESATVYTV